MFGFPILLETRKDCKLTEMNEAGPSRICKTTFPLNTGEEEDN